MAEKKEQKIVVFTENNPSDNNLILYGIKLAGIFRKELCLFNYPRKKKNTESGKVGHILENYKAVVSGIIPSLRVTTLILSGQPEEILEELADKHEAVIVVLRTSAPEKFMKIFRVSPIPFLFVDEKQTDIPDFKKVVLPIDLRKETRDAILWSSYFARFNNSLVNVLAAADKVKDNARDITKNVLSVKSLFAKFNLGVNLYKGKTGSLKIQFEALEVAKKSNADLLIILGSSYVSFLDLMVGLPEKKILQKAGGLPVLIVNPRKDMYVLCD
jgi:hypothetical protein